MVHYKNLSLENIEGEVWRDIKGFEPYYSVSNLGRIKSKRLLPKERIMKLRITDRYLKVNLKIGGKINFTKNVHRIVAEHFLVYVKGKIFVNHKNGIKTDNRSENLEWCTAAENKLHAIENKLSVSFVGENNIKAFLKKEDILDIRRMYINGTISSEIKNRYGLKTAHLSKIITRRIWKHV